MRHIKWVLITLNFAHMSEKSICSAKAKHDVVVIHSIMSAATFINKIYM